MPAMPSAKKGEITKVSNLIVWNRSSLFCEKLVPIKLPPSKTTDQFCARLAVGWTTACSQHRNWCLNAQTIDSFLPSYIVHQIRYQAMAWREHATVPSISRHRDAGAAQHEPSRWQKSGLSGSAQAPLSTKRVNFTSRSVLVIFRWWVFPGLLLKSKRHKRHWDGALVLA